MVTVSLRLQCQTSLTLCVHGWHAVGTPTRTIFGCERRRIPRELLIAALHSDDPIKTRQCFARGYDSSQRIAKRRRETVVPLLALIDRLEVAQVRQRIVDPHSAVLALRELQRKLGYCGKTRAQCIEGIKAKRNLKRPRREQADKVVKRLVAAKLRNDAQSANREEEHLAMPWRRASTQRFVERTRLQSVQGDSCISLADGHRT